MLKTKSNNFEQSPQTPKRQNSSNARFLVVHRFLSVAMLCYSLWELWQGSPHEPTSFGCNVIFHPFFQVFQKNVNPKVLLHKTTSNLQKNMDCFGALEMTNPGDQSSKYLGSHQSLQGKLYSKCTNHHPADEAEKQRCLAVQNIGIKQWKHTCHVSAKRDPFLRRYLESYNLTRKLSYWVLPTFFNVSSFLCVKVCTVVRYLICLYRAYDLDQKNAGSYAPDKFFNQILFANTQCMVYLPTFG